MDTYNCEAELEKVDGEYNWGTITLTSTIDHLNDCVWLECDLYEPLLDNEKRIKQLPDGLYNIKVSGNVWFESDADWETGVEQGSFLFDWSDGSLIIEVIVEEESEEVKYSRHDNEDREEDWGF